MKQEHLWCEIRRGISVAMVIASLGTILLACAPPPTEAGNSLPASTATFTESPLTQTAAPPNYVEIVNNPIGYSLVDCIDVSSHSQIVHAPKPDIPEISTKEVEKRYDASLEKIIQGEVDPELEKLAASSGILYLNIPDGRYSYSTINEIRPGLYLGTEHVYNSYKPVTEAIVNNPDTVHASIGYFNVETGQVEIEKERIEIIDCQTIIGHYLVDGKVQIAPIASVIRTNVDTPSISPYNGIVGGPCDTSAPMKGFGFNSETLPSLVNYEDMSWAGFNWKLVDGTQIVSLTYPVSTTGGSSGGEVVDSAHKLCGVGQYIYVKNSSDGLSTSYETGVTPLPSPSVMDTIIKKITTP